MTTPTLAFRNPFGPFAGLDHRRGAHARAGNILSTIARLKRARRDLIMLACELSRVREAVEFVDGEAAMFEELDAWVSAQDWSDRKLDFAASLARVIRFDTRPQPSNVVDFAAFRAARAGKVG